MSPACVRSRGTSNALSGMRVALLMLTAALLAQAVQMAPSSRLHHSSTVSTSAASLPIYGIRVLNTTVWPKPDSNHLHLGDVRAVLEVPSAQLWGNAETQAPARHSATSNEISVQVFWRRRDDISVLKSVVVTDKCGQWAQVVSVKMAPSCGLVSFNYAPPKPCPSHAHTASTNDATTFYLYWLPYYESGGDANLHFHWYNTTGFPVSALNSSVCESTQPSAALVTGLETRDAFHGWDWSDLVATPGEIQALAQGSPADTPFLAFLEQRETVSRTVFGSFVPAAWVRRGLPARAGGDTALTINNATKGEFVAFQVGIYAHRDDLHHISLAAKDSPSIPSSAWTLLNAGGVDCYGNAFMVEDLSVARDNFQVLWVGIDVPIGAGVAVHNLEFCLNATVSSSQQSISAVQASDGVSRCFKVNLNISDPSPLPQHGQEDVYRMARLKWLNSRLGIDDTVPQPFENVGSSVDKNGTLHVTALNKDISIAANGLPSAAVVKSRKVRRGKPTTVYRSVFGHEMAINIVDTAGKVLPLKPTKPAKVISQSNSTVTWAASSQTSTGIQVDVSGSLHFDSYAEFSFNVTAIHNQPIEISDIQLVTSVHSDVRHHMVGMGTVGINYAPTTWRWASTIGDIGVWIGRGDAGVYLFPKGNGTAWNNPLFSKDFPVIPFIPSSWGGVNATNGTTGANFTQDGEVTLFSGARRLEPDQAVNFLFDVALTPSKNLDLTSHWPHRYFQVGYGTPYYSPQQVHDKGATVVTLHQGVPGIINGSMVNPYINYPFLPDTVELLENYTSQAHSLGMLVKYYYTIRELSNHAAELFALYSLRGEIVTDGDPHTPPQPGYCHDWDCHGGDIWLREHILYNYSYCWQQSLSNGEIDAAVCDKGESRWFNYYAEGASWAVKNAPHIDGIYYDGLNFDRTSMARIRKLMTKAASASGRPVLIDVHTGFDSNRPPAIGYLSVFPYVNRLWNGEGFNFGEGPVYWLTLVSGFIHGTSADRLGGGPQYDFRGMLFGITQRNSDTAPALWSFWDKYGINTTTPIGFWEDDPVVRLEVGNSTQGSLVTSAQDNCGPSTFNVTDGSYYDASGGWKGNWGFGGKCGEDDQHKPLPPLTPEDAVAFCCNGTGIFGHRCEAFSISKDRDAQGRGTGCFKLNTDSGIVKNSDFLGYLRTDLPPCGNTTADDSPILSTAFVDYGSHTILVIASWCARTSAVTLDIAWNEIGLDPSSATLVMPEIPGIQKAATLPTNQVMIGVNSGAIIVIS